MPLTRHCPHDIMKWMIRILIVDDNQLMRRGLRSLLVKEADLQVVGEASDGEQAIAMAARLQPDVVLLDISMPKMGGLPTIDRLHSQYSGLCVLVVSMHTEADVVQGALDRGACGYVLKQDCFTDLVPAIKSIFAGNTFVSPSIPDFRSDEHPRHQ
jgi:DNA-binding NarL/FixJ family response regulator